MRNNNYALGGSTLKRWLFCLMFSIGLLASVQTQAQTFCSAASSAGTISGYTGSFQQLSSVPSGSIWYWTTSLLAGATYTWSNCVTEGGTAADTYLRLYDASSALLLTADDICGVNANFSYTPSLSGTYYIVLSNYSCSTLANSQILSYMAINIPTGCTGTPTAGTTTSSAGATACSGVSFTLSLTGSTVATGITYQWQTSPTGAVWTSVGGATNATYTTSIVSLTHFRCVVGCSNSGLSANSTDLTVNAASCINMQNGSTTTCAGNFYDSGGPSGSYLSGETYVYTIFPNPGNLISVSFSAFSTESGYDGLSIYNGPSTASPLISSGLGAGSNATTAPAGSFYGSLSPGTVTSSDPSGALTFRFTSDGSVTSTGWAATISCISNPNCSSVPTPGNTISTANPVCTGSNFTLSLQNTAVNAGISYQWQSSPTGSGYTNIGGATLSTYTTTQSSATYYQCVVTCSFTGSGTSNPLLVSQNAPTNCYCTPPVTVLPCTYDWIGNVTVGSINNTTACAASSFTYYAPAAGTTTNLVIGQSNTITLSDVNYSGYFDVFIDYNQDGVFNMTNERVVTDFIVGPTSSSSGSYTGSTTFSVPGGTLSGTTRMRVRYDYYYAGYPNLGTGFNTGAENPCSQLYEGETEDYVVTIVPLPADPANPLEVGVPNCATGGTLTANGSAPVGEAWYWETCASCTSTALPATSNLNILANGTYYIRSFNSTYNTWSNGAGSLTVTDFPAGPADPVVTAPAGNPACGAVTLVSSVASAGSTNYWQGTNAAGTSTSSVADDGSTNTPFSAPANGIYYLRGRDNTSFCWSNSVATTVTIYPLPTAPVLGATPSTVCPGSVSSLTAVAPSAPATGYTVASIPFAPLSPVGAPTAGPSGDDVVSASIPIGFSFNYYGTTYTNFVISTNGFISFDAAPGSGCCAGQLIPSTAAPNNVIADCWTDLNTAYGGNIDYFNLTSPNRLVIRWNGVGHHVGTVQVTSQIVIYASGVIEIHNTSINLQGTMTQGVENAGGTLATAVSGRNASGWAATNDAYRFSPTQAMGFLWTPNGPANGIAAGDEVLPNIGATPTSNTVYTMTLTEPAHNCQSSSTITVNVAPTPPAPTTTDGSTACGVGTATLQATTTGGTLNWYRVPTGGTILGTGTSFTTPNPINADSTFYVEESNGTCSGPRSSAVAHYTSAPTVSVSSGVTSLCNPGSPGTTLNATGGDPAYVYTWSPAPGSVSGTFNQNASVNPASTTTYTVTGTNSGTGCSAQSTITISVAPTPVINSVTATPPTICQGGTSQLSVNVQGASGGAYVVQSIPYSPVSPSAGTTPGPAGDDAVITVPIGFSFNYYGTPYTSVNICTNGFINFGAANSSFSATALPNATAPSGIVALAWQDLNTNNGGNIDYFNLTSPNRLVVRFNSVATYSSTGTVTGEIIIYGTGEIEVHNTSITTANTNQVQGIQNIAGSIAVTVSGRNAAAWNAAGDAYQFVIPPPPGFTFSWTGGVVSDNTIYNPTATLGAPSTTYNVTVNNAGCTASGSVTLSEPSANPGNTVANTNPVCPAATLSLSLQNPGSGAQYQWQSSPDGSSWTNIGSATNSTYSTTQASATYYRASVGCPSGSTFSNPLQVTENPFYACYCAPPNSVYNCTYDWITNVTSGSINNNSVCTAPFISYPASASTSTTYLMGLTYPLSVTVANYSGYFDVFIDLNHDGSYSTSERLVSDVLLGTTGSDAGPSFTATGNIVIPTTGVIPGPTGMRVRYDYFYPSYPGTMGSNQGAESECGQLYEGETEDYTVTIAAPDASSNSPVCEGDTLHLFSPAPGTSYSWTTTAGNGFTSTLQNPSIPHSNPSDAGVYTVHIVFPDLSFIDASATVVVNATPPVAPTADPAFCEGTQDLHLTSNAPTAVSYLWKGPGLYTSTSADPVRTGTTSTMSGSYKVIVTDANTCKDSATVSVTVYALPPADITPIGSTNICTGQTTTDLQATGGTSYSWSTSETTDLITVSTQGTYTVIVTDAHGCVNTDSQVITESTAPAQPIISPAGPVDLCSSDGGATYTSVTFTVQNYNSDLLWSTSETTTSITVNYGDVFNVTYTDPAGCYSVSNLVQTNALLASVDPTGILTNITTNNVNNICLGNNVTLSVNGGTLGDNADWHWYEGTGACGTGTVRGTGSSVTITPTSVGIHHYTVRAEGTCGPSACASIDINVTSAAPTGTPNVTSSPTSGCNGTVGLITVSSVSGATFYSWNGTSGALYSNNIGGPFVAGPYQTASAQVYVQFANPAPAGQSGYNICVFGANACGQSGNRCVWIRSKVSQPFNIGGNLIGCANSSSSYTIVPIIGADTYTWTITGAAGINGGGATLTTASTTITVNFGGAWSSGTLSVYASMNCGFNSAVRNLAISTTTATPGTMNGPAYVCPNSSASFNVAAVPGASSYNWTTSVPGAVVSPSSNSASILFPAVIPAGSTVCVTAVSGCGIASVQRCKSVANGIPNIPGNISGPTAGQCEQSGVSYTITPVFGATSYLWSASTTAATIVPPNNLSGASVNFNSTFSSVVLSVTANNACGSSAPRTLTVLGFPGLPAAITGNAAPCAGTAQTYTTAGSSGATGYAWTVPAGSTIIGGQGSGNITVIMGSTAGNIAVTASNNCGVSGTRLLPITIPCRQSQVDGTVGSTIASLFPNPTTGKTTVKFESVNTAKYVISVVDVTGRIIISDEVTASEGINTHELDLTGVAKGVYLVRMESAGEQTQLLKVTVE